MSKRYHFLGNEGFGTYEIDLDRQSFQRIEGSADSLLVPGFVDIHTHGAFGIDFMSATETEMVSLSQKLANLGYEAFLPTTVTASADDVKKALSNLPDLPMIAGFHLEGPFISPVYPGAQPKESIVDPPTTRSEWDEVLNDPRLKVITMAPERPGALDLIRRLNDRGVKVSMGHTNATYAEAEAGYLAGGSHTTHTYNAMRSLHHREPGLVGFAMGNDEIYCELIYDRLHVKRGAAEVLLRTKSNNRVVAISDSVMAAGLPAGQTIRMWKLDVVVGDREVRLTDGTLAGSGITLLDAFRNLAEDFGQETAIKLCSINPRRAIGLNAPPSRYVEFDQNLQIVQIH